MILTVSTVKDTLENLQRFVADNLAGGVDHMVVFLDAGDPEVRAWLDGHEHVTCIRTDASWWNGERPGELNVRQRVNANLVKAVLSAHEWAQWVFHIDADEVVQLDREILATVPDEIQVVRLRPLEAVSQARPTQRPTLFKRKLGKADLVLLKTLGVIERPANGAYFHGHVEGKAGVRPGLDRWLTLHLGVDENEDELPSFTDDALCLLHYESFSGEEFVRKWTSILSAGPQVKFRPARSETATALRALIGKDLDEATAERYLMRLYERTTADDVETLTELGLLEKADPTARRHEPAASADQVAALRASLEGLRSSSKVVFHPGGDQATAAAAVHAATGVKVGSGGSERGFLRR